MWRRGLSRMPARRVPIFYSDHVRYESAKGTNAPHPLYRRIRDELETMPGFALVPAKPCAPELIAAAPLAEPVKRLIAAPNPSTPSTSLPARWSPDQLQHHLCTVGGAVQAIRALKDGHQIAGSLVGGSSRPFPENLEHDGALFDDVVVACASALRDGIYKRILICDLSADCPVATCAAAKELSQKGDGAVFSFSVHTEGASDPASPCDFVVECKPGTPDHLYLDVVRKALVDVVDTVKPDLIIYRPGVESLCAISAPITLSRKAMNERNMLVFRLALERKIPVFISAGSPSLDAGFALVDPSQLRLLSDTRLDVFRGALQSVVIDSHRQLYF